MAVTPERAWRRVVLDHLGKAGGWRDGFAVLGHAFDVQGERLLGSFESLIEGVAMYCLRMTVWASVRCL
jgi:hypothetical protein